MIASEVPIDVGVGNIVETSIDIEAKSVVVEVEIEAEVTSIVAEVEIDAEVTSAVAEIEIDAEVTSVVAEVEIDAEITSVAAEVEIEIDTGVKAQTVSTVKKVTLVIETKWRAVKRCLLGRKMLLILLL